MNSEPCIKILKALADLSRWRIVCELLVTPCSMGELARRLELSDYNTSKHVRILREAGLVKTVKKGKSVECGITPELQQQLSADKSILDLGCCTFRFDQMLKTGNEKGLTARNTNAHLRKKANVLDSLSPSMSISSASTASKTRYIMIGGFLGAGKTTAVARLAQQLTAQGLRIGLITNDQGSNLVDTALLRSKGFATEEIPGGCFCCRFNSLLEASQKLTASTRPEVFIAEPVGSCTDLAATVTYPLRRLYGDQFTIAPVSVLVDPVRALRVFGVEPGGNFSAKVVYIYKKQIEDADLVVINKCDLLDAARVEALRSAITAQYPGKEIVIASARDEIGLDAWFSRITHSEQNARTAMEVDYEVYADGEALLGWLNCTVQLAAPGGFAANPFLKRLAGEIQSRLQAQNAEVAHLKMTLSPDAGLGDIAVVNLVRNDFVPELSLHLEAPVESGQLIINLRAEADPDALGTIVQEALAASAAAVAGMQTALDHMEHFRPGKPNPTHRFTQATA